MPRPPRAASAVATTVLVAALGLGCMVPPGLGGRDAVAERRAYDSALRAARSDPRAGRDALDDFLRAYPRSRLADDARLALARLERADGRDAEAEAQLRALLGTKQPASDRIDEARLELAELLLARGETAAAWEEGQRIRTSLLAPEPRARADRLFTELARERGDGRTELELLARQRAGAEGEMARALDRRIAAALPGLEAEDIAYVAERSGKRPPAVALWLAAAERWLAVRDVEGAERALRVLARLPLEPAELERKERLAAALGRTAPLREAEPLLPPGDPPPPHAAIAAGGLAPAAEAAGVLGVVLPLTGPFAAISEQTLRGVLLGAGVFDPLAAPPPAGSAGVRVLVRDSGGDPARAADAVRELAGRGDVDAVVGPMLTEEVQAAADAAQESLLPLLALTRHESVARSGGAVFRVALTRRMEAAVLAEHAVYGLGLRRFAILHPKDDYGREFESLLWQALEARGAEVIGAAGYAPDASDFTRPIQSLVGWSLLDADERRRLDARAAAAGAAARGEAAPPAEPEPPDAEPLPPIVDFDALFIPDAPDKVALILPQLAVQGVRNVRLVGTSAWHNAELLRREGKRLEGAFFTSAFDPASPAPVVQDFVARYRSAFGEAPSAFAAQGFDAAHLVALQLAAGASDAEALRRNLLDVQRHPGVSGVVSVDPDGNARKRPFLLGVEGGALVSLE